MHSIALRLFTFFLLCCASFAVKASRSASADSIPYTHFISIRHDNDCLNLIGGLSDHDYTAGIFLDYAVVLRKRIF